MRRISRLVVIPTISLLTLCLAPAGLAQTYTIVDLGTLGGSQSGGAGINTSGQVTGYAFLSGNSAFHAFLYSGGSMADLGTLGGSYSAGYGINTSGQVTGDAITGTIATAQSSKISHRAATVQEG